MHIDNLNDDLKPIDIMLKEICKKYSLHMGDVLLMWENNNFQITINMSSILDNPNTLLKSSILESWNHNKKLT